LQESSPQIYNEMDCEVRQVIWLASSIVIPHSEIAGTKPPYVCPGCFIHTYSNNSNKMTLGSKENYINAEAN
jgi:hypothetical protein